MITPDLFLEGGNEETNQKPAQRVAYLARSLRSFREKFILISDIRCMKMEKLLTLSSHSVPFVREFILPADIPEELQEVNRHRNCVFCSIAHGNDPTTELLYKRRRRSQAPPHSHAVPDGGHRPGVLRQQGAASENKRVGYHWPPFISVPHLHLHAIGPEEELSMRARIIFQPGTRWFLTTKEVIARINSRHLVSSL
ncbi:HIT domain-containing protein [Caerostris darwini]|uniref:HIT domain-containing protein n=1 Tax=Caerostris darwini TaxID=1538125 RepID=A0AAV4RDS7_9ARAC|nr:HIT domain-containing protein [Caerostris darwini]